MSCSISAMVVPYWLFTSRMKRDMSSFSSRFMPAIGSSSSRRSGSMASARPSSTRFCRAVGQAADRHPADFLDLEEVDDLLDLLAVLDLLAHGRAVAQQLPEEARFILSVRPAMMLSSVVMPRNSATFWNVRAMPPLGRFSAAACASASRP